MFMQRQTSGLGTPFVHDNILNFFAIAVLLLKGDVPAKLVLHRNLPAEDRKIPPQIRKRER